MIRVAGICFCILFSIFLVGCATKGDLPSGYQFDSQSKEGVVVFSISCNVAPGILTLVAQSSNYMPYSIPVNCYSDKESLSQPQLKVMNLSPGRYHFRGFSEQQGMTVLSAPGFKYIYFDVKPGVVSYLGWFAITDNAIRLANGKKHDIPWFKQLHPGITAPIEIQRPDFSQDEDPMAKLMNL